MDLGLHGRVAIVGGASQGIGRAAAATLLREGARVAICARGAEALAEAARALAGTAAAEPRSSGADEEDRVLAVPADLARADDMARVVARTVERWGRVDVAVNNVGGPPIGPTLGMTDAQWLGAVELNFLSVVRLCRAVVPHMRRQRWGRIVNVLSLTVRQPEPPLALSTAARLAVVGYARTLSDEVAAEGITVNNVLPGSVLTARLQSLLETQARAQGTDAARVLQDRVALIPAGRLGQPAEIADLICFLASERAAYLTGLSIPFDGGQFRGTL
jgi:3-oxoacyl-[acyl-carrier protein] reductase